MKVSFATINDQFSKIEIYGEPKIIYPYLYSLINTIDLSGNLFVGMDRFYGVKSLSLSFEEFMDKIFINTGNRWFPIDEIVSLPLRLKSLLFGACVIPKTISADDFTFLLKAFCEVTVICCEDSVDKIISCFISHDFQKIITSGLDFSYAIVVQEGCIILYYDNTIISAEEILHLFDCNIDD